MKMPQDLRKIRDAKEFTVPRYQYIIYTEAEDLHFNG